MRSLFRAIANLWREYNQFGRAEYEQLRQQNEKLRAEIEAVRRRKAGLDAAARSEALGGLKMTTERLKAAKAIMEAEKGLIVDAVDKLGEEATQIVQKDAALKQKRALQAIETIKKEGIAAILGGGEATGAAPPERRKK